MEKDFLKAFDISCKEFRNNSGKNFSYGTAGFREKACELDFILYRMGLLAVLKSKEERGSTVGLMITASHNPEEDNGVKLCSPSGEMIDQQWEQFAMELINAKDEDFLKILKDISEHVDCNASASVFLGRDTRSSSIQLSKTVIAGIKVLNGDYKDFGLVTTPQLHYLVMCQNNSSYGEPTLEGYYKKVGGAFEKLKQFKKVECALNYNCSIFIDAANGVGAHKMKEMMKYINSLDVTIFNDGSKGALNFMCGADYVKVQQIFPEGIEIIQHKKYASFDGDADRVVFFYKGDDSCLHMLDGDKIASLIAKYLLEFVEQTKLNLSIRAIQTAYANGKSTLFLENTLHVPVVCVPTGVKHLHHEAKKYDIGIYFEANGHGTVLFSNHAKSEISKLVDDPSASENQRFAARKLLVSIDLINETVGDAISDLLMVEAILYDFDWSIQDWDSMYMEFAYKQVKVKVSDRKLLCTTDAGRICVQPIGLQDAINSTVLKIPNSRAFVRASGTEDVVRVYVEAEKQEDVAWLAEEITNLVKQFIC